MPGSTRLEPGSAALVETALTETTGGNATRAKTWSEWVKTVKASKPSLLVLLAHSVRDELTAMTALEIETDERRDAAEFTTRYLHPDEAGLVPPLVFLLGCDTAVADLQYQTFVTRFRQLGAALVVGTISTVAGSHAAGVAAALVRAVKREDQSGWLAFGDLLRDVRRGLLADGEVMALCLTAYGDADWRFPGGKTRPVDEEGARMTDTVFSIEMFPAQQGDALWIEYGPRAKPHRILIDGGTPPTIEPLRTRIKALAKTDRHFDLIGVTHIDTDHIGGMLRLISDRQPGALHGRLLVQRLAATAGDTAR